MGYDFLLADETSVVHPVHQLEGGRFSSDRAIRDSVLLSIDGERVRAAFAPGLGEGEFELEIDGRRERVFIVTRADTHFIHFRGRAHRVEAVNALERARRAAEPSGGTEILRAPMPGTVVDVVAQAGMQVDSGALLLTIESMKLQTAINAPHDATIAEVFVSAGATFDQGDSLVRLEAPDGESDAVRSDSSPSDGAQPSEQKAKPKTRGETSR